MSHPKIKPSSPLPQPALQPQAPKPPASKLPLPIPPSLPLSVRHRLQLLEEPWRDPQYGALKRLERAMDDLDKDWEKRRKKERGDWDAKGPRLTMEAAWRRRAVNRRMGGKRRKPGEESGGYTYHCMNYWEQRGGKPCENPLVANSSGNIPLYCEDCRMAPDRKGAFPAVFMEGKVTRMEEVRVTKRRRRRKNPR